jgi:hypothetical protein
VPFLVIDIAQTAEGEWIVIECNDAQESGYGGVERLALWQEVFEIEEPPDADRSANPSRDEHELNVDEAIDTTMATVGASRLELTARHSR